MTRKFLTAEELAEKSKKTKRAIYKNPNLPYDDSEGQRLYDPKNPIVKKYIKGQSIRPQKPKQEKTVKIPQRLPPGKKPGSKKKANKDYDYLKNKLPAEEHELLDDLIKKFPGIEKGMADTSKKIEKQKSNKPIKDLSIIERKLDPNGFDIDEHLRELSDSGQLTFAAAMGLPKRDLEKIKIYEQIKDIKSKADERREGLVSRKLVRTVFSKIYEIDMNQFIPMKEKLIPDIAAIFENKDEAKILKAGKRLDKELWKILGNVKRELNKFLIKCGEKEIE